MDDAKVILGLIFVLALGAAVSVVTHTLGGSEYVTLDPVCSAQRAHSSPRLSRDSSGALKIRRDACYIG